VAEKKNINLAIREALSRIYSFANSAAFNEGMSNISLDDLMRQELARLRDGYLSRPSVKDRLTALKQEAADVFEQIKKTDPADFELIADEEAVDKEE